MQNMESEKASVSFVMKSTKAQILNKYPRGDNKRVVTMY